MKDGWREEDCHIEGRRRKGERNNHDKFGIKSIGKQCALGRSIKVQN